MSVLEIEDGAKTYIKGELVWKNLNFKVEEGEIIGLIGENGSGKTTLFKSILGAVSLTEGKILTDLNIEKDIGYLLEIDLFNNLTAFENLKLLGFYSGYAYQTDEIEAALEKVGLTKVMKKRVKSFSFGMKQRLRLAAAIVVPKKLLLLDEPLVGLDPNGINDFFQTIKNISQEDHTAVVISTHQIAEVAKLFAKYYYFSEKHLHESGENSDYYEILVNFADGKVPLLNSKVEINDNIIRVRNISEVVETIVELKEQGIEIVEIEHKNTIQLEVFK